MTTADLAVFFEKGWNAHDVDALMTFMTDDCVFESASGTAACGTRHEGRERVREAFAHLFATIPDVRFDDIRHVVAGNRGFSEWLFRGTTTDGKKLEVNGCDVFQFEGSKIRVKSSFLKSRTTSR